MRALILATTAITLMLGTADRAAGLTRQEVLQGWNECHVKQDVDACTRIIENPASNPCWRSTGYSERAMLRRERRDFDGALADANEAVRLYGSSVNRSIRAKVWLDKGDFERALADLNEAIRMDVDDHGYFARGIVQFAKGDFAAAISDFMRARTSSYEAREWLYFARARTGEASTRDLRKDGLREPVVQFLLGERSEQDLLATAGHDGARCEGLFFIAERNLLRGRNADAAGGLKQVVDRCQAWDDAFTLPGVTFVATEELKRLLR